MSDLAAHYVTPEELTAPWRKEAACRGADPSLFFPDRNESSAPARAICAGCPVTQACLKAGDGEPGIWGGQSAKARGARTTSRVHVPAPIRHGTTAGYRAHYRAGQRPCEACRDAHHRWTCP